MTLQETIDLVKMNLSSIKKCNKDISDDCFHLADTITEYEFLTMNYHALVEMCLSDNPQRHEKNMFHSGKTVSYFDVDGIQRKDVYLHTQDAVSVSGYSEEAMDMGPFMMTFSKVTGQGIGMYFGTHIENKS